MAVPHSSPMRKDKIRIWHSSLCLSLIECVEQHVTFTWTHKGVQSCCMYRFICSNKRTSSSRNTIGTHVVVVVFSLLWIFYKELLHLLKLKSHHGAAVFIFRWILKLHQCQHCFCLCVFRLSLIFQTPLSLRSLRLTEAQRRWMKKSQKEGRTYMS